MTDERNRFPEGAVDRFWRQTTIPENRDSCWTLTGRTDKGGYAAFRICSMGINKASHAVLLLDGKPRPPKPNDLALHGDCSNPLCVNPRHLRWGSREENVADMMRLGRCNPRRGDDHPFAKITTDQAIKIRADPRTQTEIASDYGVSQACISKIKRGQSWHSLSTPVVLFRPGGGSRSNP